LRASGARAVTLSSTDGIYVAAAWPPRNMSQGDSFKLRAWMKKKASGSAAYERVDATASEAIAVDVEFAFSGQGTSRALCCCCRCSCR
jgi:hypothetical protein